MAEQSRRFWMPLLFGFSALAALIQLLILWKTTLPLGVPGEWTWGRTSFQGNSLLSLIPVLIFGGLLAVYVSLVARRLDRAANYVGFWLSGLWGLGALWLLMMIGGVPEPAGLGRAPFVLYYTRSSGYFTQAREEAKDLRDFLSGYQDRIANSDHPENYLHLGTHPPGLTILFVGMLNACERWPALTKGLLATCPASFRESMEVIRRQSLREGSPFRDIDAAVLWLATFLTAVAASGTCVPVYLLARRIAGREAAWWGSAMWLLVPAAGIFLPKSDVVFPCLAMWAQWLWLTGLDRRSVLWGLAAGMVLGGALCLSLAFAPLGLIMVLQGLVPVRDSDSPARIPWKARLRVYLGAAIAFLLLFILWWSLGHLNLLAVWMQNLRNHASFYAHHTRSYGAWLLVNPIELAFAVGLSLALMAMCGIGILLLRRRSFQWDLLIPCLVWSLLWLSGKNMGETARLWIFLMPYVVWLWTIPAEKWLQRPQGWRWVTAFFLLQMLVCLLTVIRVDGFHFGELAADFATAEGSRKGSGDQRCRGGGNFLASILGEPGNESRGDRRSRAIQESGKSLMPIMDQIGPKYICCKYSGSILRKSVRHP